MTRKLRIEAERKTKMGASARHAHLAPAISLCLTASSVLVSVFLVATAEAQTYIPYWGSETVEFVLSIVRGRRIEHKANHLTFPGRGVYPEQAA